MRYFRQEFTTQAKGDNSPVTEADMEANRHICTALAALTPDIPIIAEENETQPDLLGNTFWLVDPLDGTRSFVRGEDEFTVNIGLILKGEPVLGIIYSPPQDALYYGGPSFGAFREQGGKKEAIKVRPPAEDGLVVVRSKSHPSPKTLELLETMLVKDVLPGSSSIKFCRVAEGSADIYPRLGRTMEWDTAAGHAILNAAGGRVEIAGGGQLTYNKPGFVNPGFIAYGK